MVMNEELYERGLDDDFRCHRRVLSDWKPFHTMGIARSFRIADPRV